MRGKSHCDNKHLQSLRRARHPCCVGSNSAECSSNINIYDKHLGYSLHLGYLRIDSSIEQNHLAETFQLGPFLVSKCLRR
eukprot:g38590.t1